MTSIGVSAVPGRAAVVIFVAGLLSLPRVSASQSLVEIAAREKERRKGHRSSHVFTEEDLKKLRLHPDIDPQTLVAAPIPESAAVAQTAEEEPPARDAEDDEREDRAKTWLATLQEAREEAKSLSADVEQKQAVLGDVRGSLYGPGRASQIDQLEEAKQRLAATRQRVETLEEGARRNGYR